MKDIAVPRLGSLIRHTGTLVIEGIIIDSRDQNYVNDSSYPVPITIFNVLWIDSNKLTTSWIDERTLVGKYNISEYSGVASDD